MIQKWYNHKAKGSLKLECSFYVGPSGVEPVRDWLRGLGKDIRVEIGTDIGKVQRLWPVSRPLVGSLGAGLYEVVTTHNRNDYRVLFCLVGSTMLLLHGFQKKTQRTPRTDLRLARSRQKEISS